MFAKKIINEQAEDEEKKGELKHKRRPVAAE
jgi:hypothetical protein